MLYDILGVNKKVLKFRNYYNSMSTMLVSILKIDDFEEFFDIDFKIASYIKLTEGVAGFYHYGKKWYLVFHLLPVGMPCRRGTFNKFTGSYYNDENQIETKEFTVGEDFYLWKNNGASTGEGLIVWLAQTFEKTDTSIEFNIINARYNPFLKVSNETQKAQLTKALNENADGKPNIFVNGNDDIFDSTDNCVVNLTDVRNVDKIQYLSHLKDDLWKTFANLYGVSMNATSKQAQQTEKEISGLDALSWLVPSEMLEEASKFCDTINEIFGSNLTAHYGDVHEMKWHAFANDCTKDEKDVCESVEETEDAGTDENVEETDDTERKEGNEDNV